MDETKYKFDEQFPRSVINVADFQSTMKGLHQMDLAPLRPSARRILDEMEYSTDAAAQAKYSGTGVTITKQGVSGTLVQEGSYSLKAVIDGTNNRSFARTISLNLSGYAKIKCWHRASVNSSAIQFYLSDGTNSSYWDITTHATNGTWAQSSLTLASPSSNSGSPANLAAITSYGYRLLDNGVTYYFDTIEAIVGMSVSIDGTTQGSYFKSVFAGLQPLGISAQAAPTLTAPSGNPRIDILTLNSSGTLAWTAGTEASTPVSPWTSITDKLIPICEVYLKVGMTRVVDFDDKATYSSEGYILSDCRPFIQTKTANTFDSSTVSTKTTDYTLTAADVGKFMLMNSSSTKTFTLPAVVAGYVYFLKNIGSANVTISPNGSDTVEDTTLKTNEAVILVGDASATRWRVLNLTDLSDLVALTGNQTVAGIKTFSSIPVLPASSPSADNEATRKKYVDDLIAAIPSPVYFGTVASKSAGTSYLAATDGIVSGYCTCGGGGLDIAGYTDASNPPTTQKSHCQFGAGSPSNAHTFSFFVKKNNYYKVVNSAGTLNNYEFIPLGT